MNRLPLYTYAVGRPFDPAWLAGLRGVDGALVTSVRVGDLVAVTSSLARDTASPDDLAARKALVRAHDHVVAVVSELTAVLPLPPGTVHLGRSGVVGALRARQAVYSAALDRVAGCVELGVKAYVVARPVEDADRRTAAVAGQVGADLLRVAREGHPRAVPTGAKILDACYLVDVASIDAFVARVSALDRALPDLDVVVTGPWAPYSFVAIDEDIPA